MADTADNNDTNKISLTPSEPAEAHLLPSEPIEVSEHDDIPPPSEAFDESDSDEEADIAPSVELMPEGVKAPKPRKKSSKTAKPVDIASLITATPPASAPSYPRVWLLKDYDEALKASATKAAKRKKKKADAEIDEKPVALALVADTYDETRIREDVEDASEMDKELKLPTDGMMVGEQYVMYAHFFYLKRLLKDARHITFYMDQDSGIRGACLSAFTDEILDGKADAFYVKISTGWPVWKMKKALKARQLVFDDYCFANPALTPDEVMLAMIKEEMARMTAIGDWNDRWLVHPFPMQTEPDKAVCHLTTRKELEDEEQQAKAENRLAKL